jgi:hypothetical protein
MKGPVYSHPPWRPPALLASDCSDLTLTSATKSTQPSQPIAGGQWEEQCSREACELGVSRVAGPRVLDWGAGQVARLFALSSCAERCNCACACLYAAMCCPQCTTLPHRPKRACAGQTHEQGTSSPFTSQARHGAQTFTLANHMHNTSLSQTKAAHSGYHSAGMAVKRPIGHTG